MRFLLRGMLALLTVLILPVCAETDSATAQSVEVVLETDLGNIVIEVYENRAPKTSAYFLGFVDRGDYNGGSFYRSGSTLASTVIGQQLIQGGLLYEAMTGEVPKSMRDTGLAMLEEIETTAKTGLKHQYATVSFARDLLESGFVIPDIFICLGDSPSFDFNGRPEPDNQGFPAFAKVVGGMDVVEEIAERETAGAISIDFLKGQILSEPVVILKAYRVKAPN